MCNFFLACLFPFFLCLLLLNAMDRLSSFQWRLFFWPNNIYCNAFDHTKWFEVPLRISRSIPCYSNGYYIFLSVEYSEIIQQRIRFAHIELRGNKLPVKIDAYTNYELFGFLLLLWILEMVIVDGIFAIWNSS